MLWKIGNGWLVWYSSVGGIWLRNGTLSNRSDKHLPDGNLLKILVIGGAGYIGSHMVMMLGSHGHDVTTFDNLSNGHRDAVLEGNFVKGDLANSIDLDLLFDDQKFDVVMHFASYIEVGESVRDPAKYYENNFVNTKRLLDCMVSRGVGKFIFSSTAAIFGAPQYLPMDENHPVQPLNPYGKSKWMVEQLLEDYDRAYGLKSVALRYFNAAGADPEGRLGERHNPETHLIPLILRVASGRSDSISIFGNDYDTPDGTCIRDYIHVTDLCDAHLHAIEYLESTGSSDRFNLGNGQGFSVTQVIECVRQITGKDINTVFEPRRTGDSASLVADSEKAETLLGWKPKLCKLETIIETAWNWERAFYSQ